MLKRQLFLVFIGFISVFLSALVWGQEYRATITGTVTDASKAVVPNATVTVRNLDTNEVIQVKTNAAGVYTVPFLHPGHRLEVSVEAPGFEKANYPPVVLSVSQVQTADFVLKVGSVRETMTVTSESYQVGLDSAKADRGVVIDNKMITELPLDGRNPLSILDVVAGVTNENGPGFQGVPTDMYQASWYTINGGLAQNTEYTIDGDPNNSIPWYSSGPSAIPSVDAIQEFKVITNPYDAQFGRTAGGVVSMELKSGTNDLHGTVYEFAKRTFMDANSWANNYYGLPRQDHTEDQYGVEIGGPVYIPHLYDGRNKTFFMFNWERYKEKIPTFQTFELPNPQWLQGDFSNFTDANGLLIPVFDPYTATTSNPTRQIIQNSAGQYNHVDPTRFNPIAVNVLNLIMASTHPTTQTFANELPWESIWLDTQPTTPHFNNFIVKGDQIIGSKDHLSVNYIHDYNATWYLATPPGVWQNGSDFTEYHLNAGVDWVHTFRNNLLLDFHTSYQRYWRTDGYPNSTYNPTTLGFPASLINQLPLKVGFPQISFNMQQQVVATGNGYGSWVGTSRDWYYFPDDTFSAAPTLTWIKSKHTLRFGLDFRDTHAVQNVTWTNSLQFTTNGQATSEYWYANNTNDIPTIPNPSGGTTPLSQISSGNAILDWLLGQPNYADATNAVAPFYTWHYFAPWIQDDWKIAKKLTLDLGLRYDLNGPPTARHNWLNTGFDFNAVNPVSAEIDRTAYPNYPTVTGGVIFPSNSGRSTPWARDYSKLQPRVGFAYQVNANTVLRGGYGRLVMSPMGNEPTATGFQNDPIFLNSSDGGRTYFNNPDNLTNPFQAGIPAIPGSSLGLQTNLGGGIYFLNPTYRLPYVDQMSLGIQRAMPENGKLEVSYVGSRSHEQDTIYNSLNENFPLAQQCNQTLDVVGQFDALTLCNSLTNNPFYGLPNVLGGLGANQQISIYQLTRPHPEFGGITEWQNNWGKSWYNSLQTTYTQRVSWVQVNASWTWSKTMQNFSSASGSPDVYVDEIHGIRARSIAGTDRAHRFTLTSVLNVPVGRGRKYFSGMNRPLDAAVGGWELGSSFFYETGQPLSMPGGFNLIGNIRAPKQPPQAGVLDLGMNPCYETWVAPVLDNNNVVQQAGYYQVGTSVSGATCTSSNVAWQQIAPGAASFEQQYTDAVRNPGTQQIDLNLSKTFKFTERVSMQLRLETFNVMNHPTWFWGVDSYPLDSTFGTVTKPLSGQSNNPRLGQLGIKILW